MKNKKWLLPVVLVVVLAALVGMLFGVASMRLPISYGERNTLQLSQEDPAYQKYIEAVNLSTQAAGNIEKYWGGDWPDYYGGMGVAESEGEYLVRVYLTEDNDAIRREVCEAAGMEIRAYTKTDVSWAQLKKTLDKVDTLSSIPFMDVQGIGIRAEDRCVRVYLSHRDPFTIAMLGFADFRGLLEIVIAPVKPGTSYDGIADDHTVTMTVSGLEHVTGYEIQLSTDPFFMEGNEGESAEGEEQVEDVVKSIENTSDVTEITFADLEAAEQWYVRGRSWLDVDGEHYESGWSSIKAVK